ncbi:hypothetical protein DL766_010569 [Monosporascus sp. MC13-8B]|uniref:Uncharacterized protein n=1 Tax=Monosporascus cannonballus TaxID=155416 RepID=A0ABY0H2N4_9PEZI|nr:hypothetical protein DL762_006228 [Monosporascus cannonballus]RYO99241.1 hypothetical protein DL763_001605 [Monosporascus cannonballus]RYP02015.1 hypothetical protein DL766_010569 [Monosporascus sp. MC13-8B]
MFDVVNALLDNGAGGSSRCPRIRDSRPLMWAATRERQRSNRPYPTEAPGADPLFRDSQSRSALEWALQFRAAENAPHLLSDGVPVDIWVFSARTCCAPSLSMCVDLFWGCAGLKATPPPTPHPLNAPPNFDAIANTTLRYI